MFHVSRIFARLHPALNQNGRNSRAAFDHTAQLAFLSRFDASGAGQDRQGRVRRLPEGLRFELQNPRDRASRTIVRDSSTSLGMTKNDYRTRDVDLAAS